MTSTSQLVASQPSSQQLADYANALLIVNSYAYAITNQQLPVLNFPPDNYGQFAASFAPAKQHALNWSTNIFVSIVQVPTTIVHQSANLFNLEASLIEPYLQILISDPGNTQAKSGLKSALGTIQSLIKNQVASIDSIHTQLATFSTEIQSDAQTLTIIADNALSDAGSDKAKIKEINEDITSLNAQISTAQTLLTVSEIGIGVSIFVGLIGIACCVIPGAQTAGAALIVVGVAGTAASIAGTVIEQKSIVAMQNQITSDQDQIDGLNQDIIQLKGISTQFDALYQANLKAQNALKTISAVWNQLDNLIGTIGSELTTVGNKASAADYQQALNDFTTAETNWNDLIKFAKALASVNYSWQDANGTWHKYGEQAPAIDNGNVSPIIPSTANAA